MKRILNFFNFLNTTLINHRASLNREVIREIEMRQCDEKYNHSKSLIPYGYKEFSQCEEDGIINEIFQRIGTTNRIFVEFGSGNGTENNTHALLFKGWTGLWMDGDRKNIEHIKRQLPNTIASGSLTAIQSFITAENINQLITAHVKEPKIDFLSVDLDGNDYHIWNAITCTTPRVLAMEYNAKFVPPSRYCMNYHPTHAWTGNDAFGVSLQFLEEKAAEKGYRLVACNLSGANAFFVRSDLVEDKFEEPFTAQKHYEPARYHLTKLSVGHQPSLKALENSRACRGDH